MVSQELTPCQGPHHVEEEEEEEEEEKSRVYSFRRRLHSDKRSDSDYHNDDHDYGDHIYICIYVYSQPTFLKTIPSSPTIIPGMLEFTAITESTGTSLLKGIAVSSIYSVDGENWNGNRS